MLVFLLNIFLAGLTLLCISLQKTYHQIPLKELKRRARGGDAVAEALHKAAGYGFSLRLLLWLLVGLSGGLFFVVLSDTTATPLAFLGSVALIWFGFAWMPQAKANRISSRVAASLGPAIAWLLNYLHPVFDRIGSFADRHRPVRIHTGLYQKEDLLNLMSNQQIQSDNRMTEEELRIAASALTFADKLIRERMTPRRVVRTVAADDSIGPVLMSDLHASGLSRFPVCGDKPEQFVGTLFLRDLMDVKAGGRARDVMKKDVYYVHEDRPLSETKHHLFIVVNSFEEFVGIITIEDILEQIIGKPIIDEFDKYDDMRAVAARAADTDRSARGDKVIE
jgi:CBS domain containing-hemolysin-like protein